MKNLPLHDDLFRPLNDGRYQKAVKPFELRVGGVTAGRFATYEGACTEAFIRDLDGVVVRCMYELRPGAAPLLASTVGAREVLDESLALGRKVLAHRAAKEA